MKNLLKISLAVMLISHTQANAENSLDDFNKFDQLKLLEGVWIKEDDSKSQLNIQFELTAGGTVVSERWMYGREFHSLTVYHLNEKSVMATHYCPQGNQPRLESVAAGAGNVITFAFKDATNLDVNKQAYQHKLKFEFLEDNRFKRSEVYLSKDGEEYSEMVLVKK